MRGKLSFVALSTTLLVSLLMAACGGAKVPESTASQATGAAVPHAARLDGLEGKTICELSLDEWESHRALPTVREQLRARFPTAVLVPYIEFPMGLKVIGEERTAQLLAERGCQAVVLGSVG